MAEEEEDVNFDDWEDAADDAQLLPLPPPPPLAALASSSSVLRQLSSGSAEETPEQGWSHTRRQDGSATDMLESLGRKKLSNSTNITGAPARGVKRKAGSPDKVEQVRRRLMKRSGVQYYRTHLLCLETASAHMNGVANDSELQAQVLSMVPLPLLGSLERHAVLGVPARGDVQQLVQWFTFLFRVDATKREDACTLADAHRCYETRGGSLAHVTVLLVALLRGAGLVVRLVTDALPTSFALAVKSSVKEDSKVATSNRRLAANQGLELWCEVWCQGGSDAEEDEWVPVHALHGVVKLDDHTADGPQLGRQAWYIVGWHDDGTYTDVTRRYSDRWSAVCRGREEAGMTDEWWTQLLEDVKRGTPVVAHAGPGLHMNRLGGSRRAAVEQMQLTLRQLTEAIPTSKTAMKCHPLYCVESLLGANEVIYPKHTVLGDFKGEPVYPRACVKVAYSKDVWLRQHGKQVKEEFLDTGVKEASRKSKTDGTVQTRSLYGEWQVEPFKPPRVVDGIVPTNVHGNVEVWHPACVPIGGTHIRVPRAGRVAASLGIHYAPALVGFEHKDGRAVPMIEGIVVPSIHAATVREALVMMEQVRLEQGVQQRNRAVLSRWKRLVAGALLRARVIAECAADATAGGVRGHVHVFVDVPGETDAGQQLQRCACGVTIQVEQI